MSLYHRCACPDNLERDCAHAWHYKFMVDGRWVTKTTKQRTRQKAAPVEIKAHAKLLEEGGGLVTRKAPRLKTHLEDYLAWARGDHPATADEKDARILLPAPPRDPAAKADGRRRARGQTFLEFVGDKRLDHIGPFDIERWRTARLKTPIRGGATVSRSTVNRDLNIVRGCFTKAVEWKRLKVSPVEAVEVWDVDETAIQTLTAAERMVVLTQLPPQYALYCRVTLEALLRIQEVLLLTPDDLGEASLQRRLKGGKVRAIPVSRALITDLRAFVTREGQPYVFADAEGQPPKPRSVASQMTKAFRAVGLPHVHHHVMRHTGVSDMLDDQISPKAILEYAGWTSMRMLERYGHLRDAELQRATAGTAARNAAAVAEAARQAAEAAAAGKAGTTKATRAKGRTR
jgi:integrase